MLRTLPLSLADLGQPRIIAILVRSLLVTLLIFVALGVLAVWLLQGSDPCGLLSGRSCELGWSASGFGAFMLTALGIWLLFPAVALGVIAAYSDRIVATVEALHYPGAAASARNAGVGRGLLLGLRSAVRLLIYNLVALPFYLLLLITGIGPVILFVIVNGIAIGRDFGEMVAARHPGGTGGDWLRRTRGERAAIGIIITALFLIPVVNLVAPILGATMATHLFHRDGAYQSTPFTG
jgi:CysZ protein